MRCYLKVHSSYSLNADANIISVQAKLATVLFLYITVHCVSALKGECVSVWN